MRRILILILSTVNIGDIWKGLAKKHSSPPKKYTKNVKKKSFAIFNSALRSVGRG
jgi:hypothetical protein